MFRQEKAQRGRYRQFDQIGIVGHGCDRDDVIGLVFERIHVCAGCRECAYDVIV